MTQRLERQFWLVVSLFVAVMVTLQMGAALDESSTWDEGFHLASGYRYLMTGRFLLNPEHPPLQNVLNAAPVMLLHPQLPTDDALKDNQHGYVRAFLYGGPIHADRLLFAGRISSMLLTAMLVLAAAWAGRRFFSASVGILAAAMLALDPNMIAHGHYITTDMSSTLLYFLTGILWLNYLKDPSKGRAVCVAVALGLALTSKFSMVILITLLPLMLLVHGMLNRLPIVVTERKLGVLLLAYLVALGVIAMVYGPDTWGLVVDGEAADVPRAILPWYRFIEGLRVPIFHQRRGHTAFLLGELSNSGRWYYFPVVFAVKSSTASLVLFGSALFFAVQQFTHWRRNREAISLWILLVLPVAVYFSMALISNINIGIRHILPIYPYLYLVCAAVLANALSNRTFWLSASLLIAFGAGETIAAYPGYVAFFNIPSGGMHAGPGYLRDSNLDWGQDLKKLKAYVDTQKPSSLCLDYFGFAEPKYYGIEAVHLPITSETKAREEVDCIGAISMTLQADVDRARGDYAWLRKKTPMGVVGSSIYLYDLRKPKAR